jgi:hypothetical protein
MAGILDRRSELEVPQHDMQVARFPVINFHTHWGRLFGGQIRMRPDRRQDRLAQGSGVLVLRPEHAGSTGLLYRPGYCAWMSPPNSCQ